MAEQIIISNEYIKVTISALGAEIVSVIKDGKERIWQGNPEFWAMRTPVVFPICGGLNDDKFIFEGKEYTLGKHGFARFKEFEVEECNETCAVFLLREDEDTIKQYPFYFEFRIIYTLNESSVKVEYSVTNKGNGSMYYSVGGHEGYSCPEGIEQYSIIFDKNEDLISNVLEGNVLGYDTVNLGNDTNELPLKYEYFAVDALTFLNLKSRKVWLKNRTSGEMMSVEFEGSDYLFLWTKPGAGYICIEPWCGVSDFVDSGSDITKKKGIIELLPNKTCVKSHTITF